MTWIGRSRYTDGHVSRLKTAEVFVEPSTGLPFNDGFESGDFACWAPGSCLGASLAASQSFTYDAFGNLQTITGTNGRNTPTESLTNRLTAAGTTYDVMGNVLTWNGDTYEYDALGMMTRRCPSGCAAGLPDWRYLYTADDERLFFIQVTPGAGSGNVWTLRHLEGSTLRQYDAAAGWAARDYIYRDGQLLASNAPGEGDRHFHLDHLGTPRLVTNSAGAKVAYHAYLPFGEESTPPTQDAERRKFTGHERDTLGTADAADDRDNMHARQYNPLLARFLSPDIASGKPKVPQSWNRNAYTQGNPLKYVDPNGRETSVATSGVTYGDPVTEREIEATKQTVVGELALGAVLATGGLVAEAGGAAGVLATLTGYTPELAMIATEAGAALIGQSVLGISGSIAAEATIAAGTVGKASSLGKIISSVDQALGAAKPQDGLTALTAVAQGAKSAGFGMGVTFKGAGDVYAVSRHPGNVTTYVMQSGMVIIKRGRTTLLRYLPK